LEAPIKNLIAELEQVVRLDPTRAEARLQLAGTYLLLFECIQQSSARNTMPLSAIREAAISARFESRAELDAWLHRAVGEHVEYLDLAYHHTRRALRLCPLEGAGYLYLGQLSFLEGVGSRRATGDCVAQAVRVRPHDGGVLISAGQEAAIDGSVDRAIAYWQRAFRLGPVYQRVLVRRLAGKVCPEDLQADLDFFLDTFEPELATVRQLESVYASLEGGRQIGRLRDRHARLARAEAERCGEPAAACRLWMEARLAHLRRGRAGAATDCLREAVRNDPNDPTARHRLAMSLLGQRQYGEATAHLEWCLARKPEDRSLQIALRKCTKDRLRHPESAPATDRNTMQ